jgi:hypothetical protein
MAPEPPRPFRGLHYLSPAIACSKMPTDAALMSVAGSSKVIQ